MMAWNHGKGSCWCNDKHKVCFVGVPKNGSTSIRSTFNMGKNTNVFLKNFNNYKDYTLFTVLRDPLDRLVSGYLEIINRSEKGTTSQKFFHLKNEKERFIKFIDCLEELNNDDKEFFDGHIEQQFFYITNKNGKLLPFDYILNFDNLNGDFKQMCDKYDININKKLPTKNSKVKKNKDTIKGYLNDELINKIKNIYHKDYELINKIWG